MKGLAEWSGWRHCNVHGLKERIVGRNAGGFSSPSLSFRRKLEMVTKKVILD